MTRKHNKRGLYFSPRLQRELGSVLDYPLTVLEASSGFGKTTAISDYLIGQLTVTCEIWWYTCLGEPAEKVWQGFCGLIGRADKKIAHYLKGIDIPNEDTYPEIAARISELQCEQEVLLVIDNFQLARFPATERLLAVLSLHRCVRLHIVVLTQLLEGGEKSSFINARIKRITSETLVFAREDIRSCFAAEGIDLSARDTDFLAESTEGLAMAVNLQMKHYKRKGHFIETAQISVMMEQVFWRQLKPGEQDFFAALSVFDCFTERQAVAVLGTGQSAEQFLPLLKSDLIRCSGDKQIYILHHLLRCYLQVKFSQRSREAQRQIWRSAGDACAAVGEYTNAARFYSKISAFKELLALPFSIDDRCELVSFDNGSITGQLIEEPARVHLLEYPELALRLALELFVQGKPALHQSYYFVMKDVLQQGIYEEARLRKLRGEFVLMESFLVFNDVKAMCKLHQQACELLQGPTRLYTLNDAWTFGTPSVVTMFWSGSGTLCDTLSQVAVGMPCYYRLSDGHGTGAPEAMEAEMFLLAGETERAKKKAYAALAEAGRMKQDSIAFCAGLVLARVALCHGEGEEYLYNVEWIRTKAYESTECRSELTAEVCQAFLNMVLKRYAAIPDWFYRKESIERRSLLIAVPYTGIIYGNLLLHQLQKRTIPYARFEHELQALIHQSEHLNMLLPKVYFLIYLAIGSCHHRKNKVVLGYLNDALEIAIPDQVYLPFAEHYQSLVTLLEMKLWHQSQKAAAAQIAVMGKQMTNRLGYIRQYINPGDCRLSSREFEIALLLQQRLSVKEIADKLLIAPSTVRNTMQKLYTKLNIHSKKELIDLGDRIESFRR